MCSIVVKTIFNLSPSVAQNPLWVLAHSKIFHHLFKFVTISEFIKFFCFNFVSLIYREYFKSCHIYYPKTTKMKSLSFALLFKTSKPIAIYITNCERCPFRLSFVSFLIEVSNWKKIWSWRLPEKFPWQLSRVFYNSEINKLPKHWAETIKKNSNNYRLNIVLNVHHKT